MGIDIDTVHDVKVEYVHGIEAIKIDSNANSIKIESIQKIAPAAVHIKEVNQIDPLTVESLRVDSVRNVEPLNVDRLNVTRLPMVNLSLTRMPTMDLNIRRMPPLAIGLHQEFELPSKYTIHTRLLGFEIIRFDIHGSSRLVPRERARREQSHTHERSFPDVAAVGNPAIPNRCRETSVETVSSPEPRRCAGNASVTPPPRCAPAAGLSAAAPRFSYSFSAAGATAPGVRHGG
jgi:hypothetical protein